MFIDIRVNLNSSLQRSEMLLTVGHFIGPNRCAPLERETSVRRDVYKHSAPPEPTRHLVAADSHSLPPWSNKP